MEFHSYRTVRDYIKATNTEVARVTSKSFYEQLNKYSKEMGVTSQRFQIVFDFLWEQYHRPYYNCYPTIIPMLTALNLDFDSSLIEVPTKNISCGPLPLCPLMLRLPTARNPLVFDNPLVETYTSTWAAGCDPKRPQVRNIVVGPCHCEDYDAGLVVLIDVGELYRSLPLLNFMSFRLQAGISVELSIKEALANSDAAEARESRGIDEIVDRGVLVPPEIVGQCIRLACSICLLKDNPEIISPEVLTADAAKYEATLDRKYIEKAKRRGKIGWSIGKDYEQYKVIPHTRRPHPFLVWTGTGRKIPKIVMRKGSIVHRKQLDPPTGFEEEESEQS